MHMQSTHTHTYIYIYTHTRMFSSQPFSNSYRQTDKFISFSREMDQPYPKFQLGLLIPFSTMITVTIIMALSLSLYIYIYIYIYIHTHTQYTCKTYTYIYTWKAYTKIYMHNMHKHILIKFIYLKKMFSTLFNVYDLLNKIPVSI